MTDDQFEYLLKITPPDQLRREMRALVRWFKYELWKRKHPRLGALIDGAFAAAIICAPFPRR